MMQEKVLSRKINNTDEFLVKKRDPLTLPQIMKLFPSLGR